MFKKIKEKINKLSRKQLGLFLMLVVGSFWVASSTNACWWNDPKCLVSDGISSMLNYSLLALIQFLGHLVDMMIYFLLLIAPYNNFITASAVTTGWTIVRDVSNMFFIVILMVIAVSTILRIEAYDYKRMLPKLLLMAVLINFSKLFCGLLIDASQVVTLTFVNAFESAGAGNFVQALGLADLLAFADNADAQLANNMTSTMFLGLFMVIIGFFVVGAIMWMFTVRIIAFWILIVLSPIAYIMTASGNFGSKYATQWWTEFTKYLIVGPVLAFFLWLSLSVVGDTAKLTDGFDVRNNDGTFSRTSTSTALEQKFANAPVLGISKAGQPNQLLNFLISIAMLLGSMVAAQQIGAAGSGMAGSVLSGTQRVAGAGMGALKWGATEPFVRWHEEFQKKNKFSLNPMDYVRARQHAREEIKSKKTTEAQGRVAGMMHFGVEKGWVTTARQAFSGDWGDKETKKAGKIQEAIIAHEMEMKLGHVAYAAGKQKQDEAITELGKNKIEIDSIKAEKEFLNSAKEREREQFKFDTRGWGYNEKTGKNIRQSEWEEGWTKKEEALNKKDTELTNKKEELQKTIESGPEKLTHDIVTEKTEQIKAMEKEKENIDKGYMSDEQTHRKLGLLGQKLLDIKLAIKKKVDAGVGVEKEEEQERNMRHEEEVLKAYIDTMGKGEDVATNDLINSGANIDFIKQYKDEKEIKEHKGDIQNNKKGIDDKIKYRELELKVINDNIEKSKEPDYKMDLEAKHKEIKTLERSMKEAEADAAKKKISTFYQDSARRSLESEELKKMEHIDNDSELIDIFLQAQAEHDQYKLSAAWRKLARDGNDNELLNGLGYSSTFKGMQDFVKKELIDTMHIDKNTAISLANDISYINEGANHWETARVAQNKGGEWKWLSEDDHVQAAMSEILKKDPQKVATGLNRLAYGGETPRPDGSGRDFELGKLGKALLIAGGDAMADQVKRVNVNILRNLAGSMPDIKRMRDLGYLNKELYKKIQEVAGTMEETGLKTYSDIIDAIRNV